MTTLLDKIRRHGLLGSTRKALAILDRRSGLMKWRLRNAPKYPDLSPDGLAEIERELTALGVAILDYTPSPESFAAFQAQHWFPPHYHGGPDGGVWDEKLLEHWIASERLGLMNFGAGDIFVDVAAASSPWAKALRERKGIAAYAIDLDEVNAAYRQLPYYRIENATRTSFAQGAVAGAALHCAYEMFTRDDDIRFIDEAARFLRPGGKVLILPLYMHTHYCAYASPEYFGKGYADPAAREYVRLDSHGLPSVRKYDAATLKHRLLDRIVALGMRYRLLALRNKAELGKNIYCHFILDIER